MDPLLARCRDLCPELGPDAHSHRFAADHELVARGLWAYVRASLPVPEQDVLVHCHEHLDPSDTGIKARRLRLDAGVIALQLITPLLDLEIRAHDCRTARLELFLHLATLDLNLARATWVDVLAHSASREDIVTLLSSPSREVREWALGEIAACA